MKKKFLFLLGTLLLLAAGVLCFYFFRDNPHRQIRRTLNELCEIVSKGSGENPAVSGLKANRADKVFAPKCEIKIGRHLFDGIYTPTVIGAKGALDKGTLLTPKEPTLMASLNLAILLFAVSTYCCWRAISLLTSFNKECIKIEV